MSGTLRLRLLCYTSASTVCVLLAAGLAVYYFTRASLLAEFDRSLLAEARTIQANTEEKATSLGVDVEGIDLSQYTRKQSADYFQIWNDDGAAVAASPSLVQGRMLRRPANVSNAPRFDFVVLPDGQSGRQVSVRFVPQRDEEGSPIPARGRSSTASLVVARQLAPLQSRLTFLEWLLFVIGIIAATATAGTLYLAVSRGLLPLAALSSLIAEIGGDNLQHRIDLPNPPGELKVVINRLNELLGRLQSVISRERAFTADVAHELRTPLAGLEVTLEVSALKRRTPEDYESRIDKALSIVRDMKSRVENLLMLARADAGQLSAHRDEIELCSFIEGCWTFFEDRARERALKTGFRLEPVRLHSDPDKLRVVLHNLMDNAVSYCQTSGGIEIVSRPDSDNVVISVRNSADFDPKDVDHVFDRFWRADSARVQIGVHCGLGLSLCRKMVDILGGTIRAEMPQQEVFQIVLCLPLGNPRRSPVRNGSCQADFPEAVHTPNRARFETACLPEPKQSASIQESG